MSKTITFPTCRDPFYITVNGKLQVFPGGATVEVDDSVAEIIQNHIDLQPKKDPNAGKEQGGGSSKLASLVERSVCELTEDDMKGAAYIGAYAFERCLALTKVTIPDNITKIENNAFSYCETLESVSFSNSITSIGMYAFNNCPKLKSAILPNNLPSIAQSVFMQCSELESVTIPDSVQTIGQSSFYGCNLKSVIIPKDVIIIGRSAFYNCTRLKSVTVRASTPPVIDTNVFNYVPDDCIFTVPVGSGEAYRTATNWSERADYIVEGDV